jgi:hypothetical protein
MAKKENKTVDTPKAKAKVELTPSQYALEKVGPDGDGEAYQAAKAARRWGHE